jgi:uncharacterized RmlC-like cupin family protein
MGRLWSGEWTLQAPAEGAEPIAISQPHLHPDDDEAWYVVEGRLSVKLGDEMVIVAAGGAAIAAVGTTHTLANPGRGPCRYLIIVYRASRRAARGSGSSVLGDPAASRPCRGLTLRGGAAEAGARTPRQ